MKKFSKLFAALLALIMMLSVFTACGGDKKDGKAKDDEEEVLTGEDLLIGKWNATFEEDDLTLTVQFVFNEDGEGELTLPQSSYDDFIDQMVDMALDEYSEEELAEEGIVSEEYFRDYFESEYTYDLVASEFDLYFTWELDEDELIIENEDGDTMTADTELSEGEKSFILIGDDGTELELTKAK